MGVKKRGRAHSQDQRQMLLVLLGILLAHCARQSPPAPSETQAGLAPLGGANSVRNAQMMQEAARRNQETTRQNTGLSNSGKAAGPAALQQQKNNTPVTQTHGSTGSSTLRSTSSTKTVAQSGQQVMNSDDQNRGGGGGPRPVEAPRTYSKEHTSFGGIFRWGTQTQEQKYYDPQTGTYYDKLVQKSWGGLFGMFDGGTTEIIRSGPERNQTVNADIANPGENVERIKEAEHTCQQLENSRSQQQQTLRSTGSGTTNSIKTQSPVPGDNQSPVQYLTYNGGYKHARRDGVVYYHDGNNWVRGQMFKNDQGQTVWWGVENGKQVEFIDKNGQWEPTGRTCCDSKGNWISAPKNN